MIHRPPAGEDTPPTGFHEFRSKRDYKKNKRNTNKTPHATKGRRGRRPPRRSRLVARKQFADWHDWFPDEKTTQKEWKSWYPDDRSSPPSGNFFEFMAKSRRHQRNVKKAKKGEAGMTHTGKHLGGAGGKKPKQGESEPMLTGGPKTTMGKGQVVRMLTPGELKGQRERAKEQTRSSLSKRRKKEILDQLRAEGKLHEFGLPAVAAGIAAYHIGKKYLPKAAKWAWGKGKTLLKKGGGIGASGAAGALARRSARKRGRPLPSPSGTRPTSMLRTATRSRPNDPTVRSKGASRARERGEAEKKKKGALRGFGQAVARGIRRGTGMADQLANLSRRSRGKAELENR